MDLQLRTQLRATLQDYISGLMVNNKIPASLMEDALEHILLQVREATMAEYVDWAIQDKDTALQELENSLKDTPQDVEEENEQSEE